MRIGTNGIDPNRDFGNAYTLKGDSVKANHYFKLALEKSVNDHKVSSAWGTSAFKLRNYSFAIKLFESLVKHGVKLTTSDHYILGASYLLLCDLQAGARNINAAIQMDSLDVKIRLGRGLALFNFYQFSEIVINDLNFVFSRSSDSNEKIKIRLLRCLLEIRKKNFIFVENELTDIIRINPKLANAYIVRGYLHTFGSYSNQVVEQDFQTALKLTRTDWHIHAMLGSIFLARKKKELAVQSFETASKLNKEMVREVRNYSMSGAPIPKKFSDLNWLIADVLLDSFFPYNFHHVFCDNRD